jgi:hypothetical protein
MAPQHETDTSAKSAEAEKATDTSLPKGDTAAQLEKTESHVVPKLGIAKPYILYGAVFMSTFLMALNGSIIATV